MEEIRVEPKKALKMRKIARPTGWKRNNGNRSRGGGSHVHLMYRINSKFMYKCIKSIPTCVILPNRIKCIYTIIGIPFCSHELLCELHFELVLPKYLMVYLEKNFFCWITWITQQRKLNTSGFITSLKK